MKRDILRFYWYMLGSNKRASVILYKGDWAFRVSGRISNSAYIIQNDTLSFWREQYG